MSPSQRYNTEFWVWFCLTITVVVVRYLSQYIVRKQKFLKEIPKEDILMAVVVLTYTTSLVSLHLYYATPSNTDHYHGTPEYESGVARRLGILSLLLETALQTTLWGNKFCLLLFYKRITLLGIQHNVFLILSMFIGLPYVAVIVVLYDGWCRPFSEYLVPHSQNKECVIWTKYSILQLSMNLSTDLVLMLIPLTRIISLQMNIKRKLMLLSLFSMGIFIMTSAILLKIAVFSSSPKFIDPPWIAWIVREVSTAVLAGNLVLCVPAIRTLWGFFSNRVSGVKNRITTSGNGDETDAHPGRRTAAAAAAAATFEPGNSKWRPILEAPWSP
ncbi:hypothetical protein LX36DRAFT_693546 [Colletotrichum falcatum]|nr:hypothetical protein LX36DRAFT_693546 [Colletotrichum falcatum]